MKRQLSNYWQGRRLRPKRLTDGMKSFSGCGGFSSPFEKTPTQDFPILKKAKAEYAKLQ
jgi:hypothetical protein